MSESANKILLEIQYLPCIQYFSKLVQYDTVIIEKWENYSKGSYRNRCHIASANGLHRLSIPLQKGKNEQQHITDVQIWNQEDWQRQHWITIQSAYGNAPFWDFYEADIAPLYTKNMVSLFDFNYQLIQILSELIGISVNIEFTTAYEKEIADTTILDARNTVQAKANKQQNDPFFTTPSYPQVFIEKSGFLPNLSILDLLFCTGPQTALLLENSIINEN